ncbi:hypothetical protein AMD27_17215 (plasmid) [Acinetobacter sp. TGL-Y2]|nr:hypothetical protein AMD27_17215 [Acinetobacter sp. TGL-Y2]
MYSKSGAVDLFMKEKFSTGMTFGLIMNIAIFIMLGIACLFMEYVFGLDRKIGLAALFLICFNMIMASGALTDLACRLSVKNYVHLKYNIGILAVTISVVGLLVFNMEQRYNFMSAEKGQLPYIYAFIFMPVACLIAGTIKDKILKSEVKDEISTTKINNDEYSIDAERKMTVTLGLMSVYVVIGLIIGSIF